MSCSAIVFLNCRVLFLFLYSLVLIIFALFYSLQYIFDVLSFHSHVSLLFPYSFVLVFLSFLSISLYSFNQRLSCHDVFLSRYTFGPRFFLPIFRWPCLLSIFRYTSCHAVSFFALYLFLFFSFSLKTIDFVFFFFFCTVFLELLSFYHLVLLELYSFHLICQICFQITEFTVLFHVYLVSLRSSFHRCLYIVSLAIVFFFFILFFFLVCNYCFSVILLSFFLLSFSRPISHVPRFIHCLSHTLSYQFVLVCS